MSKREGPPILGAPAFPYFEENNNGGPLFWDREPRGPPILEWSTAPKRNPHVFLQWIYEQIQVVQGCSRHVVTAWNLKFFACGASVSPVPSVISLGSNCEILFTQREIKSENFTIGSRKSNIFRRKFHGILPELREIAENCRSFVNFAEKSWKI